MQEHKAGLDSTVSHKQFDVPGVLPPHLSNPTVCGLSRIEYSHCVSPAGVRVSYTVRATPEELGVTNNPEKIASWLSKNLKGFKQRGFDVSVERHNFKNAPTNLIVLRRVHTTAQFNSELRDALHALPKPLKK